jgi:hypothetical protein
VGERGLAAAPRGGSDVSEEADMGGRIGLVVAGIALGALGASATGVSLAGDGPRARTAGDVITLNTMRIIAPAPGRPSGIVVAGEVGRRAQVNASLHGLQPDRRYRVVGSTTPCTRVHTDAARVFSLTVDLGRGDDQLAVGRVSRRERLSRVRSARIYDFSGTAPRQAACGEGKLLGNLLD